MRRYNLIPLLFILAVFTTCRDNWDDHTEIEASLKTNLWQEISSNSELSTFASYLTATGYDQLLQSSKTITVWAPSNESLVSLRSTIVDNPDSLAQFVGNHIGYSQYFTQTPKPSVRIRMVSEKNLNWFSDNLEGVELLSANRYTRNGVLHVLNGYVLPKMNIWEYLKQSTESPKQRDYLVSLNHEIFIDSLATQIGVNPANGRPIYETGTGLVTKNNFLDEVANIDSEDSLYTFIMLTDNAFDAEMAKLTPYFKGKIQSDSITLKSWHLVKDLAFKNYYAQDLLPGELISKWNVKVPIDKSAIIKTIPLSNGIIYVMSKVNFALRAKIDTIRVEGESSFSYAFLNNSGSFVGGNTAYIHHRIRNGASNGMDLEVSPGYIGSGGVVIMYNVPVYSGTYEVYWTAYNNAYFVNATINGVITSVLTDFSQRLTIDAAWPLPLATSTFPLTQVGLRNPVRRKLGEYTVTRYKTLRLYLVSNYITTAGAAINASPLTLDKIELVPKLN